MKIGKGPVWIPDLKNGKYRNPIIHADYSDPDVIRIGEDYYMVSSSFNMSPCLPVLHSKDLVNWEIINHVADRLPFSSYDLPRHGDGVWAPSLRYHNGKVWVFFAMPDEGIFMSTAADPWKEWTPLHCVKEVKGWIDPCPFWDEDGNAYLVNAFAKSRIGFKSILHLSRMKPDGTSLLDEGVHIFNGTKDHPTIEGPKMYKRNGYYYIFAPAGGVEAGWQTILRSKNIYGPYEDKIVLHQGNTDINGPHQGGWVETDNDEHWFVHFQDKGAYGRIVHMQPMYWENDWPVMGINVNEEGIGEPVLEWKKPDVDGRPEVKIPQTNDDFIGGRLRKQWQWRANYKEEWYALTGSGLRLFAVHKPEKVNTIYDTPNVLTQKFPAENFTVTTKVRFLPNHMDEQCGLVILGTRYAGLCVKMLDDGKNALFYLTGEEENGEEDVQITKTFRDEMFLRVRVEDQAQCIFSYSEDGETFNELTSVFSAAPGKWIGAQIGIYCAAKENHQEKGFADFQYFYIHS